MFKYTANPGFFTKTVSNIKLKLWNQGTLNKLKKSVDKWVELCYKWNIYKRGKNKIALQNLSSMILSVVPDSTT